ncbi:MAG: PD-(D/E)XK nuclease family protein [Phycisphaerales bacterium]|nr:PD-(D/E)XK nuclease family protein [Phycisphaerales bacterium]
MTLPDPQAATRVFLGRDRPALVSACRWLIDRFGGDGRLDLGRLDLSGVAVVTPGARAGRLLLGALVDACDSEQMELFPPELLTPGSLADRLLEPAELPEAGGIARTVAWAEALRMVDAEILSPLVPHPPKHEDLGAWRALGEVLAQASSELASFGLTMQAAAERVEEAGKDPAPERWRAAAAAQRAYIELLEDRGLCDPELARIGRSVRADHGLGAIVLVSPAELTADAERVIAEAGAPVWSLIAFDEGEAEAFDALGRPVLDRWADRPCPLADDAIVFAEGADDQAERALVAIAELDPAPAPDEIVIGTPDPQVTDALVLLSASVEGLRVHDARGLPIEATPPVRLLEAMRVYLLQRDQRSAADLIRHPEVERWLAKELGLGRTERWLLALDRYLSTSLPPEDQEGDERADQIEVLATVFGAVSKWLEPLDAPGATRGLRDRRPDDLAQSILDALAELYSDEHRAAWLKDRDLDALRQIAAACADLASCTHDEPPLLMDAPDAIGLVLDALRGGAVREESGAGAVELVGWLELALDPSPVLVLTGMNEGVVPPGPRPHPLLNEQTRADLGLPGRRARLGLDAFRLHAAVSGRRRVVAIAGRRDLAGDPLRPSRLLLIDEDASMAARVLRWAEHAPGDRRRIARRESGSSEPFCAPVLERPTPPVSVSVTAFKRFLESPYKFYLTDILRLDEADDRPQRELDALVFGNLIHGALEKFGLSDDRDDADPDRIELALHAFFDEELAAEVGSRLPATVRVQADLAKRRLSDFAERQAERRCDGWRIVHCEQYFKDAALIVDGRRLIGLRGRIDRIDRNDKTGEHAIIDYKTGQRVDPPGKTHVGRNGWKDLQLPLYRHLAKSIVGPGAPLLGYGRIGAKRKEIGFAFAEWDADELHEADLVAADVAERILACDFFGDEGSSPEGAAGYIMDLGEPTIVDRQPGPEGRGGAR